MDREFNRSYKKLNSYQREAVETIDGPVLVIAGPGTGKTQLLSMRVANILKKTDAQANNILALTYTNKAAVNMKERIIDLVGQEGTRINASTFHSFAGEIMNLYPDYFWNAARLSVAPDSVQLDIIESIISRLPLDNPLALKFAGQFTLLNNIQTAINLAKEAGLTPAKLRAIIKGNLAYIDEIETTLSQICAQRLSPKSLVELQKTVGELPDQPIDRQITPLVSLPTLIKESLLQAIAADMQTKKVVNSSKWKSRWIQTHNGRRGMFNERLRNDWWLNLAQVYENYRRIMHSRGFYDYADMIVEVISQLEKNTDMRADIQERFSHVLLDEFQDTTPAQLRLAHLIADHFSVEGNPNLMAVGDDDQTIFKFSGAELNNMLHFKRTYPSAKIIVLTENYRSSQAILDLSKKIIDQASTRLVKIDPSLNKDLIAVNPPEKEGVIQAIAYSSAELQLSEIVSNIKSNYSPKEKIAVLARSHSSLIKMAGLLVQNQVPVHYEQAANVLEHEIVKQVYLISQLILAIQTGDEMHANSLVHKIIRWAVWGLSPKQLWGLALNNYPDKSWVKSLIDSSDTKLKALGEWLIWLASVADSQPLGITLEQILGLRPSASFTSPIRDYFVSSSAKDINQYFHALSAIQLLRSLAHDFVKEAEPRLDDLVRFMEINHNNKLIIADESPFVTGPQAVQLLTVHKAKGLEFDHVYIIDVTEDNWRQKSGGRKPPSNLPLQPVGDDFDDYVRLLYVAATRAKSSLTITSYYQDHAGKDIATSSIVQGALNIQRKDSQQKLKLINILEQNLRWPELTGGQEREIIKTRLADYNLSVTHFLNFLDISKGGPQYFKEKNLLRLPEAKKPSLSYGSAVHAALDSAQRLTNLGQFQLKSVIESFDRSLKNEQLPIEEFKRYRTQGRNILKRLFNELTYQIPKGSQREYRLREIKLDKAVIAGRLDRVDKVGPKVRIVDYKTGRPLTSFETKDKNQALKAYKHRLQLIFYALLWQTQLGAISQMPVETQMVYVEADSRTLLEKSYLPSSEDIVRLQRLVEAVWQKIQALDFPDVSQYSPDIQGIKDFEKDLLI